MPLNPPAASGTTFAAKRSIAMTRQNENDERCEALFASALQRSDLLNAEIVTEAISATLSALGSGGCACRMAEEFGDHPEAASERMQWARQVVQDIPTDPADPAPPTVASFVRQAA
jgi:hypothetical protein